MKLFVGIDVSLKDFKARMFDVEGKEIAKRHRAKNDEPGAESFVKYLVEICSAHNVDSLRIGYAFNPTVVANFKKQYVDIQKDDWFDCLVIPTGSGGCLGTVRWISVTSPCRS